MSQNGRHPIIIAILLQGDLDPTAKRKAALMLSGVDITEIAAEVGVSRPMVHQVIGGRARSARVESAIAEALGVPRPIIWPRWWTDEEVRAAVEDIRSEAQRRMLAESAIINAPLPIWAA